MKIDVGYVAELARLELSEEEKAVFQPQLESIVGYVEKISAVDVDGVEPMMHGRPLVNAFREDVVRPSLPAEYLLVDKANLLTLSAPEMTVLVGGLLVATLLTLVVLPVFYSLAHGIHEKR